MRQTPRRRGYPKVEGPPIKCPVCSTSLLRNRARVGSHLRAHEESGEIAPGQGLQLQMQMLGQRRRMR
jgi:hypothetical protein